MRSSEDEPKRYLRKRFGVGEEELRDHRMVERSGDYWLIPSVSVEEVEELDLETAGIRFLRRTGRGLKPTTYGLQVIEDGITRNVVQVERDELSKLLRREGMIPRDIEEEGYVAIRFKDKVIGCGMFKDGVVSSRIPKGRGSELAEILERSSV